MTLEELKALIEKATANFEAQKKENLDLTVQIKTQEEKFDALKADFDKLKEGGDQDQAKKMATQLEELVEEISDLRSKYRAPASVITDDQQKKAIHEVVMKSFGAFMKKNKGTQEKEIERRLIRNANIVLSSGKKAVLVLAAKGVGPDTASRILATWTDGDALYREILKAERNFIRTHRFWQS